jgi:hypothetical protein
MALCWPHGVCLCVWGGGGGGRSQAYLVWVPAVALVLPPSPAAGTCQEASAAYCCGQLACGWAPAALFGW